MGPSADAGYRRVPRWTRDRDYAAADAYAPHGSPSGAAFFDFDKTLLRGDSALIFGRAMAKWIFAQGNELSPPARAVWYAYVSRKYASLLWREAAYRSLHKLRVLKRSKVVELGYLAMAGWPTRHLTDHMEGVWERELKSRLYPQMLAVMEKHRKLGQRVVIVTTGVREIVEHARKYVGADVHVIAVDMAQEHGLWTGKVTGPLYGGDKAALMRDYAAHHGIDLHESYAYSDHYSDIEFLKAVGYPVAINPRGRLRRVATRRRWTILDLPDPAKP